MSERNYCEERDSLNRKKKESREALYEVGGGLSVLLIERGDHTPYDVNRSNDASLGRRRF